MLKTLKELSEEKKQALADLIEFAGSQTHLARMLGDNFNLQMVHKWTRLGGISKKGAEAVANHPTLGVQFPISRTRPDLTD